MWCFRLVVAVAAWTVTWTAANAGEIADMVNGVRHRVEAYRAETDLRALLARPDEAVRSRAMAVSSGVVGRVLDDTKIGEAVRARRTQGPTSKVVAFVSNSMKRTELRALFEAAAGRSDVVIVFRGIPPGKGLRQAAMAMAALAAGVEPAPNVTIDPVLFRDAGVTDAVPVLALMERQGDRWTAVARAEGLLNVVWFKDAVEHGNGATGVYGPVQAILEPDFIEDMKRRIAGLDYRAMKDRAKRRYWERARFEEMPPAPADRIRTVDPSFEVARDIVAPDGTVIVAAGTVVNPLQTRPFNRRVIVFDARDPDQVARAVELGKEGPGRNVYLATALDRTKGWDALREVERKIGAAVYLLTPDLRKRFGLEHTVSVVTADGDVFKVREYVESPARPR